jgi:hypothetical protein
MTDNEEAEMQPEEPMLGRASDGEGDRDERVSNREWLHRLASYVATKLQRLRVPVAGPPDVDAVNAAKALLRSATVQAAAVDVLNGTQIAEAGAVNVRAILDTAAELRFMLLHGDRVRNARKYLLSAWFELRRHVAESGRNPEDLAAIDSNVERLREVDPDAFAEVQAQRRRKRLAKGQDRYHWSGLSRSEIVKRVEPDMTVAEAPLRDAFKVFSWDTHSVMAGLRDVREIQVDGESVYRHVHWQSQEETAETNASVAFHALSDAWQVFMEAFSVALPEDSAE